MKNALLRNFGITLIAGAALAGAVALAAPKAKNAKTAKDAAPTNDRLDVLIKQIQSDPGAAKEAEVQEMLRLAKDQGRCHAASLVVRGYLAHHFQPSPQLMRATAEAAYLSGDYTFAATRLKSYLIAAEPSEQSARAAALLYTLLCDQLEADEDAYQFLAKYGVKFRTYPAARRFDTWFLDKARSRNDVVSAARLLASVATDKLPDAMLKTYYAASFNWLTDRIARPEARFYEALSSCQKIAVNYPGDAAAKARFALYTANLAYQASSTGKDDTALAHDLAPVTKAAQACFAADPTAKTLVDICNVLAGGNGFDWRKWAQAKEPKQATFVACFNKLPDAEKVALLEMNYQLPHLASTEQWMDIANKNAKLLATTPAAGYIPLPYTSIKTLDECRKYAEIWKSAATDGGAVVRALATGKDLPEVLDALVANDAWQLNSSSYNGNINNIFRIWREMHKDDPNKTSGQYIDKVWIGFGEKHICNSPIALYDSGAVDNFLRAVWASSGDDPQDKSKVPGYIEKLAWTTMGITGGNHRGGANRNQLCAGLNTWSKDWANQLRETARKTKDPKQKAALTAKLSQITPVLNAVKDLHGPADTSKAPNPLCKALADYHLAETIRDTKKADAAEAAVYALIRNFARQKTPFGRDAFIRITTYNNNAKRGAGNWDLQVQMLADQLAGYDPSSDRDPYAPVARILAQMSQQKSNIRPRQTSPQKKAESLKVAEALGQAVIRLADKGQFSPMLFDAFRGYRVGRGWTGGKVGQDVLIKLMDKQIFQSSGYRPDSYRCRSATVSYMYLIRNEFPELDKKYPLSKAFDDMFVEEARKTHFLDYNYWDYARDTDGKIAAVAASLLSGNDIPVGDDREGSYSLDTLNRWLGTALKADSPLRKAAFDKIEAAYGKTRFDAYALGVGRFTDGTDPRPADRKEFFAALDRLAGRATEAPVRVAMPPLSLLNSIETKDLTDAETDTLLKVFTTVAPDHWSRGFAHDRAVQLLITALRAKHRNADLLAVAGPAWKVCRDIRDWNFVRTVANVADDMRKAKNQDVALAYSSAGLTVMQRDLPAELRSLLTSVRTWATAEMGGMIPVTKGNPLYALYESQLAYLGGRYQTAWTAYAANRAKLLKSFKEFDPMYVAWVIEKETEFKNYDDAEALAREIMAWFDEVTDQIEAEARARIQLAYANIAAARGDRPRARALYERIVTNKDFAGTRSQMDADLAIADVDTQAGNYDKAVERLTELTRRKDPYLQTEAAYHMALVKYAQEDYAAANEQLANVFALNPDHANGRILEGKVNLKLKKLEQPTDIDLGEKIGKKYIIPGQPVRVTLVDQNLSVVRKALAIEIHAWSDSGDEEFFTLSPFGDSKTKFKGQITTALGAPVKGDKILQVLGNDKVHYAYSDAFAAAQKIEFNTPLTLQVISDAELYVSSGAILTKDQREAKALEEMIKKRLASEAGTKDEGPQVALSTVRQENQIKPGNRINIRVVDPDRSETPGRDKITVRVSSNSGDAIDDFELTETGDYTGIFEGAVPTASAQATATASDSLEGSEANFTISKKDYPAWVGLPKITDNKPKTLSVNLNDNVALGKMKIVAAEQGRKLKDFQIQTSFNGRDFTTVASWPKQFVPWDGNTVATFATWAPPENGNLGNLPDTLGKFKEYFEQGYIRQGATAASTPAKNISASWDYSLAGTGKTLGFDSNKNRRQYYVAHVKAAFYQPYRMVRTFTLKPRRTSTDESRPIHYVFVLDGKEAEASKTSQDASILQISENLPKGVHVLEVYVSAEKSANPSYEVTCDTPQPPYEIACPDEMFSPTKHPEINAGLKKAPAVVTADADKSAFDVTFPADSRAKVVRLLIADFETDAPAVNHITLTDASGKQVLPTQSDFMDLRRNGVLEIVPGDRVTVTYKDPRVLTLAKTQHEAFLTATNTDAKISACFVEYSMDNKGHRQSRYIGMRRFGAGDPINVFINDPDGDVSDKQDKLKFSARTSEGKAVTLDALETEAHSGVFLGVVFPVAGDPNRPSELKVTPGDDVILTYMDMENVNPGIPWKREVAVEQVRYTDPQVRVYNVSSVPIPEADEPGNKTKGKQKAQTRRTPAGVGGQTDALLLNENVPDRRTLLAVRPEKPDQPKPATVIVGGPVLVEVLFPAIAKSVDSTCTIYAQSASGRVKAGLDAQAPGFDPNVPGTIKLTQKPGDTGSTIAPPGYRDVTVRGNPYAQAAIDDGRYTFSVPVGLGAVPAGTLIHADEETRRGPVEQPTLMVSGSDEIFIGLNYKDADGKSHWLVRKAVLTGDSFFDVMDRRYEKPVAGAYVGESVYFRVIDPAMDANDSKDVVGVDLTTKSGETKRIDLVETFSHSGVFKGLVRLVHAQDKTAAADVEAMPTIYGDVLTAKYASPRTHESSQTTVEIYKGADGSVLPFTKRFKDPQVAVETQFLIAESYFELAKRHRQLGEESLARREIAQGRKLLEEAIADYPNTSARAQAEYLLADLSLESGNDAVNAEMKKKFYLDAIAKYGEIVASYPDSEYAPKAQFRKALAYEKLDMLDEACEEYVKLSYRYPDNPLVAETIARLGNYFLTKGRDMLAKADKQTDLVQKEKDKVKAADFLKTGGQVFARLCERFPNHPLAGKTLLLSAQCFMQAGDFANAIKGYDAVMSNKNMDKELIAEAMYWAGRTYMDTNKLEDAYHMFKNLTWDYPASKWAKFARGSLADERLIDMGTKE